MKTPDKLTEQENSSVMNGEHPLDPFAVDFFGIKKKSAEPTSPEEIIQPKLTTQNNNSKPDWSINLPKISNRETEFSYLFQQIPDKISEKAQEKIKYSLSRFTFKPVEKIDLSVISNSETNFNEALKSIKSSPKVYFTVSCQPTNDILLIALNSDFASSIIDLMLGGKGTSIPFSRKISQIEKSILQFLALNVLNEINDFLEAPILQLQNVSLDFRSNFADYERGMEVVANLELDGLNGIISLISSHKFIQSLSKTQNPLLIKKKSRKKVSFFEKFIRNFDMFLQVGTTTLDSESLLFLEPNDIVLLDNNQFSKGVFAGRSQVYVGRGKQFRLVGKIEQTGNYLNLRIDEILSEETRRKFSPAKFNMELKENKSAENSIDEMDEIEAEISAALENIQLSLRVEIAGNKITLKELQSLHSGQIIALGCRSTDPVRLVTDNADQPVAIGELIEIEGQLGVRLTKVFI